MYPGAGRESKKGPLSPVCIMAYEKEGFAILYSKADAEKMEFSPSILLSSPNEKSNEIVKTPEKHEYSGIIDPNNPSKQLLDPESKHYLRSYISAVSESKVFLTKSEEKTRKLLKSPQVTAIIRKADINAVYDKREREHLRGEQKKREAREARGRSVIRKPESLPEARAKSAVRPKKDGRYDSGMDLKVKAFWCDLCGKNCEHDFIEGKVFTHNNCGSMHKSCLVRTLSLLFWRKNPDYYGTDIVLLTTREKKELENLWKCPLCWQKLDEKKDIKCLLSERDLKRQEKMKNIREESQNKELTFEQANLPSENPNLISEEEVYVGERSSKPGRNIDSGNMEGETVSRICVTGPRNEGKGVELKLKDAMEEVKVSALVSEKKKMSTGWIILWIVILASIDYCLFAWKFSAPGVKLA